MLRPRPEVLIVALVCVLTAVSLGLGITAFVRASRATTPSSEPTPPSPGPEPDPSPSSEPSPSPSPTPVNPYPVPSGLFCTFLPDDFLTTAPECAPDPANDPNVTYCAAFRNQTDFACARSACSQFFYYNNASNFYQTAAGTTYDPDEKGYYAVRLMNDAVAYDGGTVRMEDLMARFMTDNAPSATEPAIEPPPGPIFFEDGPGILLFDVASYENDTSFETTSRELARQTLAFTTGMDISIAYDLSEGEVLAQEAEDYLFNNRIVMSPQYCSNEALQAIGWLNGTTNVTLNDLWTVGQLLTGLPITGNETEPANWVGGGCTYLFTTSFGSYQWFCDLFDSYYEAESIRDLELLPSPWRDFTTIYTAINQEFENCGEPLGCVALLPE